MECGSQQQSLLSLATTPCAKKGIGMKTQHRNIVLYSALLLLCFLALLCHPILIRHFAQITSTSFTYTPEFLYQCGSSFLFAMLLATLCLIHSKLERLPQLLAPSVAILLCCAVLLYQFIGGLTDSFIAHCLLLGTLIFNLLSAAYSRHTRSI